MQANPDEGLFHWLHLAAMLQSTLMDNGAIRVSGGRLETPELTVNPVDFTDAISRTTKPI
jgi:hypothetical protein